MQELSTPKNYCSLQKYGSAQTTSAFWSN